jgi:hypothetical protein
VGHPLAGVKVNVNFTVVRVVALKLKKANSRLGKVI